MRQSTGPGGGGRQPWPWRTHPRIPSLARCSVVVYHPGQTTAVGDAAIAHKLITLDQWFLRANTGYLGCCMSVAYATAKVCHQGTLQHPTGTRTKLLKADTQLILNSTIRMHLNTSAPREQLPSYRACRCSDVIACRNRTLSTHRC